MRWIWLCVWTWAWAPLLWVSLLEPVLDQLDKEVPSHLSPPTVRCCPLPMEHCSWSPYEVQSSALIPGSALVIGAVPVGTAMGCSSLASATHPVSVWAGSSFSRGFPNPTYSRILHLRWSSSIRVWNSFFFFFNYLKNNRVNMYFKSAC